MNERDKESCGVSAHDGAVIREGERREAGAEPIILLNKHVRLNNTKLLYQHILPCTHVLLCKTWRTENTLCFTNICLSEIRF